MYRRRMCRRTFRRPKKNYQIVRPGFNCTIWQDTSGPGGKHNWTTIVNPADVTGVRKVKNFKLSLNTTTATPSFYFAIVYVPKGYAPNEVFPDGVNDLYSPANNVLVCGFYDATDPTRQNFYSHLSRNLQAGDGIALCYKAIAGTTGNGNFQCLIEYAITF